MVSGIGRFCGLAGKVLRRLFVKRFYADLKEKNHADLKEKEPRFSFLWIWDKTDQKYILISKV